MTKVGRVGLAPSNTTEVGDYCCVFRGAPTPFVLVPVEDGRHRFVGGCYVRAIMGGELVDKFEPYDIVLE